LLEIFVFLTY